MRRRREGYSWCVCVFVFILFYFILFSFSSEMSQKRNVTNQLMRFFKIEKSREIRVNTTRG